MQDAIYKPHQINDEVFLILYCQEQPFKPILFRCVVSGIDKQKKRTFYYTQPIEVLTGVPDVLTVRCINKKTEKYKDIIFEMDKGSRLNWVQQFSNAFEDWLFDCNQHSIYETKSEAVLMINKLNNTTIMRLNEEIVGLMQQNNQLNGI